jgi:alanine dehydrogenase
MNSGSILFLSSGDVRALLTLDECIAAVELAFRFYGEGRTVPPAVLGVHVSNGGFHIKAGVLSLSRNYFAAKVNANFPENPTRFGLATIQGMIILCDVDNGSPLALLDSGDITALRTAAATAVASKHLARPDSRVVTICGCGIQGRAQLAALARIFPLETVFAYDQIRQNALDFERELTAKLNIPITVTDELSDRVRCSDICVTCTTSQEPLISEGDVCPGIFIAAVGADNPQKQEIHSTLMGHSKIVCDVIEQCAAMGDLHHALNAGTMLIESVHGELGEIVAGRKPGRESAEEVIVFDSTGMALQDVAAAATVYEKAIRERAGTSLKLAA